MLLDDGLTNERDHSGPAFDAGNLNAVADGVAMPDEVSDHGLDFRRGDVLAPPTECVTGSILVRGNIFLIGMSRSLPLFALFSFLYITIYFLSNTGYKIFTSF